MSAALLEPDFIEIPAGFRSRHYDSASTAALVYQAESMLPLNGGVVTGLAGSSGGNVVYSSPLPHKTWTPSLATPLVSGTTNLTHVGSYQRWARV